MRNFNKKIKVLQINKSYHPNIGGVETIVKNLAEGLRRLVTMQVLVCNTKRKKKLSRINDVDIIRSGSLGMKDSMPISFKFFWDFKRASFDKDILQFHMPFPLSDIACLLFRPKGKIVVWWHSEIVRQKKLLILYRPIMHMFLKRADKIIVATPNHLKYTSALSSYLHKCIVIPFGIDIRKYQLKQSKIDQINEVRAKYGPRIALFTGRLTYYKGIEFLIRAMSQVDCHLIIIGNGSLEIKFRKMVSELNIINKVSFLGAIADDELPIYYNACDIFIFPSVARSEAFGIVQLEAMASGKPVINTQLETGVPWVSVHGVTGITVPPCDSSSLAGAMNLLFQNDVLRMEYGENAYLRVKKHFDIKIMLNKVMELYVELDNT